MSAGSTPASPVSMLTDVQDSGSEPSAA